MRHHRLGRRLLIHHLAAAEAKCLEASGQLARGRGGVPRVRPVRVGADADGEEVLARVRRVAGVGVLGAPPQNAARAPRHRKSAVERQGNVLQERAPVDGGVQQRGEGEGEGDVGGVARLRDLAERRPDHDELRHDLRHVAAHGRPEEHLLEVDVELPLVLRVLRVQRRREAAVACAQVVRAEQRRRRSRRERARVFVRPRVELLVVRLARVARQAELQEQREQPPVGDAGERVGEAADDGGLGVVGQKVGQQARDVRRVVARLDHDDEAVVQRRRAELEQRLPVRPRHQQHDHDHECSVERHNDAVIKGAQLAVHAVEAVEQQDVMLEHAVRRVHQVQRARREGRGARVERARAAAAGADGADVRERVWPQHDG
mmetsp:Transcript_20045/g.70871  ORF Transcript_20045/g.70871 Transcript_20045/m.70871 type:complete len:375 (-) Transcript_20045:60-1184(-)